MIRIFIAVVLVITLTIGTVHAETCNCTLMNAPICGDVNGDGVVDSDDTAALRNHISKGDPLNCSIPYCEPCNCECQECQECEECETLEELLMEFGETLLLITLLYLNHTSKKKNLLLVAASVTYVTYLTVYVNVNEHMTLIGFYILILAYFVLSLLPQQKGGKK